MTQAGNDEKILEAVRKLRHCADQIELLLPLFDANVLAPEIEHAATKVEAVMNNAEDSCIASEEEYRELLPHWLRMWKHDAKMVGEYTRQNLQSDYREPEPEEDEVLWRQRLLALLIRLQGKDEVRGWIVNQLRAQETAKIQSARKVANDAMMQWGEMELDEFLENWPEIDKGIVDQVASIIGIQPRRSRKFKVELYKASHRHYCNSFL